MLRIVIVSGKTRMRKIRVFYFDNKMDFRGHMDVTYDQNPSIIRLLCHSHRGAWILNISDSGKDGPSQKMETKRRVYLGSIPRIRRRSYRKTVASIRRTMCPPLPILISDHNASRQCAPQKPAMGWISSRRFPGWWRNIAQVIGFVRGAIKGQVVREQNDQKTSL